MDRGSKGWFNGRVNLSRIVERWAESTPDRVAVHFRDEDVTWRELWERVREATVRLASLDVRRGDRVAYLGYNHPEMLALLFACARLGSMFVPLNFRLARPEHEDILSHADPSVVVVGAELADRAEELRRDRPETTFLALEGERAGWRSWRDPIPEGIVPRLIGTDADPVLLVYTSGTTGKPKGAMHTQSALLWNVVNATVYQDLSARDHVLTVLPLFHVGGLCIQTLPALHAGGTLTLHPRFDAGTFLRDVAARGPTTTLMVPATLKAVLAHPAWAGSDLSSLRAIHTGSSAVPASVILPFHERGIPVGQVYGSTETGPVSIYLRAEDAVRKMGSAGRAAMHAEVRLVDRKGHDVPPGEVGEIWIRAPNLMSGYWKEPDHPALREGWFRSGDLARVDEEGFYWVVGRAKDMIVSGGENVYPAEIESVLAACPDIVDAAVVGMPDEEWGEVAVAAVVRKPGAALDGKAVLDLFEGRLARYKRPHRVVFVTELPRNALGKVRKDALRGLLGG